VSEKLLDSVALAAAFALCACASQNRPVAPLTSPPIVSVPMVVDSVCDKVTTPPSPLGLDPFYTKYCDAAGIAVASAAVVPDDALRQAARVTAALFTPIPEVRKVFIRDGIRVSVIGEHQAFGDIPENGPETRGDPARFAKHRADGAFSPDTSGPPDPVVSDGEENVLCYARDGYIRGENILVHVLAHNIKSQGLQTLDATFEARVKNAFDVALAHGKYQADYARTSPEEYWAESVQAYFDVHGTYDPNAINTRAQLAAYDPTMFAIIDGVFHGVQLPACPPPSAATFGHALFRLRSAALGDGRSLDVTALHPSGRYSGQAWTITATSDGCYRLTNQFQPGLALDVANDGSHAPVMAPIRDYAGQCWVFSDVTRSQFRLSNRYLGDGTSLDATSYGVVMSAWANTPAQLWTVTPF
jgi:hypothetical protein